MDGNNFNPEKTFYFSDNLSDTKLEKYDKFCIHVFCVKGSVRYSLNGKKGVMKENDCLVIMGNSLLRWSNESSDLEIKCLFIANKYLDGMAPDTGYNSLGMISMLDVPLTHMTPEEFSLCLNVIGAIKSRLSMHDHLFYNGTLRRAVETLMLDIFNFHSHNTDATKAKGNQGIKLFRLFISMVEGGEFKEHREVQWYANQLNITPKYLSEISLAASSHSASYWINRFTTEEISRMLHDPSIPIADIVSGLHFNTHSYFSHYVKERLGMSPKDYRLISLGLKG